MKKVLLYIASALVFFSCTKHILLRDVGLNKQGLLSYGENSNRTFYLDKSISTDPSLLWVSETDGSYSNGSVIIYDNYMFAADLSGNIFCFSDTSGKKLGVLKQKGEIVASPIIMKDKLIYVVNNYKEEFATLVYYLFIEGIKYKEIELHDNFRSEMIAANDGIILLSQSGVLYKFNLIGELEWKYDSGYLTMSDPVIKDNTIYFSSVSGKLLGYNITKKLLVLNVDIAESIESTPTVLEDKIYIGDSDGVIYCFDIDSKRIEWERETGVKILNRPVIDKNGNLYVGNLGGEMFSYSVNGQLRWVFHSDGLFNAMPLVFNNVIAQPDLNKKLIFLDPLSGTLINEINFERRVRTSPVFYKGKIYIGIDKDEIHVFSVEEI